MKRQYWRPEGNAGLIFGDSAQRRRALATEPGFHNVLGVESAFQARPLDMDFIRPASPYHHLKGLSTRIYRRFLAPRLKRIPKSGAALDAGCGIGRFTPLLAERFRKVMAFDPSWSSLRACRRHLREKGLGHVDLRWADLSFLDFWPADSFDVVLAMELIGYTDDPVGSLRRLVRVAKPGALILLSLEARPGALCAQAPNAPERLRSALAGEPLLVPGDRYVRYFDLAAFRKLLRRAHLSDVVIEPSHYLGEGPFWQAVDDARLGDPAYVARVLRVEDYCRTDPQTKAWARVLSASARKLR